MLVFWLYRLTEPQSHGPDPAGVKQKALTGKGIEG